MSLSKSELITQLDTISSLYNDVNQIREKINNVVPEDNYVRKVAVPSFKRAEELQISSDILTSKVDHASVDSAKEAMSAIYENACKPPMPPKEPKKEEFKEPKKPGAIGTLRGLSFFAFSVSIFFLLGGVFSNVSEEIAWTIPVIYTISAFSAIIGAALLIASFIVKVFNVRKVKVALDKFNKKQKAQKDKYSELLGQHKKELEEYRLQKEAFLNEYFELRPLYLEYLEEEASIKAQLEKDKKAAICEIEKNELLPALDKLDEANDIIGNQYLPIIDKIISLLKSGRADTVKEAVNLYEELLYKERQLAILKEQEEQRLLEERLRHEEMMFYREQEYQRQLQEQRRQEEADRLYREEEERRLKEQERTRQAEERRREARRQHEQTAAMYAEQRATQRQCNTCAFNGKCSMAYRRSNCASYRPK